MLCVAAVYRKMYELNEIQQSAPEEQTSAGLALDGEEVSRRKSTPVKRGTMVSVTAFLGFQTTPLGAA